MEQEKIDIIIERYQKHLKEVLKNSSNQKEKELIKNEQEMLKLFGINGITSGRFLFTAGDLIKLTIEVANEIQIIEARIVLFSEYYGTYFDEKDNRIFQIMNDNIVIMEMIDIPDEKFYESIESGNNTFKKLFEDKGKDSYN